MPFQTSRQHSWLSRTTILLLLIISFVFYASNAFISRPPITFARRHQHATLRDEGQQERTCLHMAAKSGGKIITSEEEFENIALSESLPRPVMVFFTAPWCGPCRLSIPVVKEVIKEYAGQIESVECCTDDFPEVASNAGVVSIPTIQIYYQGEVQDTIVGCVAKKVLSMAVEKVLEDTLEEEALNGDS